MRYEQRDEYEYEWDVLKFYHKTFNLRCRENMADDQNANYKLKKQQHTS